MPKELEIGKVAGKPLRINNRVITEITASDGISATLSGIELQLSISNSSGIINALNSKVDKEPGKELSSNNFTTELKNKLDGIQEGATNTVVEESLSSSSTNTVQNKIIKSKIDEIDNTLDSKMDKVAGEAGQIIAFGSNGNLEAIDSPIGDGYTLESIEITSPPRYTTYYHGDDFNRTGMVVTAVYKNKLRIPITGYTVNPTRAEYGNNKVTISVTDGKVTKTIDQPITVNKRLISPPSMSNQMVEYTGGYVTPEWSSFDREYINEGGNLSGSEIGQYHAEFSLRYPESTVWITSSDPTATLHYYWSIVGSGVYGFELNLDESNPSNMITYLKDNRRYRPARMNYESNQFDYGDWGDVWFIKNLKPVMLGYDGQVKYELNKNNYKQKATGGDSDVTKPAYAGNAMVGIPTVWIKVDNSNERRPKFYFAQTQKDGSYKAYAHINNSGVVKDYIYMAAYDTYFDGSRLRSVSGQFPKGEQTMDQQRQYCKNNGTNWDMGTFSDRMLITLLLMLIGKSTDTQTTFGWGNASTHSRPGSDYDSNNVIKSGTLDDKGLFYGYNDGIYSVKVFGIENFWGNIFKRTLGLIQDNGVLKYKLTKGTQDGSTTSDYSTTSTNGYITSHSIGKTSSFWISNMKAGPFGLLPVYDGRGDSFTTYFCDLCYNASPSSVTLYHASFGGYSSSSMHSGAFNCYLYLASSSIGWKYGVSLSYKPN